MTATTDADDHWVVYQHKCLRCDGRGYMWQDRPDVKCSRCNGNGYTCNFSPFDENGQRTGVEVGVKIK